MRQAEELLRLGVRPDRGTFVVTKADAIDACTLRVAPALDVLLPPLPFVKGRLTRGGVKFLHFFAPALDWIRLGLGQSRLDFDVFNTCEHFMGAAD